MMPLKVTAAALSVLVHSISNSLCHFLKSQVTFTPDDLCAPTAPPPPLPLCFCWERSSEATWSPDCASASPKRQDGRRCKSAAIAFVSRAAQLRLWCCYEFTARMPWPQLAFWPRCSQTRPRSSQAKDALELLVWPKITHFGTITSGGPLAQMWRK